MSVQVIKVTSRPVSGGKVELTAHLVDGSSEVIAKKVTAKPVVQMYRVEINGNVQGLGGYFTIGKTVRHPELHAQSFEVEAAA